MGTPDNLLFAPQQQNGLITIWPAINTFQYRRAMSFAPSLMYRRQGLRGLLPARLKRWVSSTSCLGSFLQGFYLFILFELNPEEEDSADRTGLRCTAAFPRFMNSERARFHNQLLSSTYCICYI